MKKTIVAALLGTALTLGSVSAVSAAAPFTDLNGHFAADAVNRLVGYQMIGMGKIGSPEPAFAPNSKADRIELKAWIRNALGKDVTDTASSSSAEVTRLEAATWIASALPDMNTGIHGALPAPYQDVANVSAADRKALNLLYNLGIMVGDGAGHFNPAAALTRGEAAAMLDRALERSLSVANKVEYSVVSTPLPEAVQQLAQENRMERGISTTVVDQVRYVVISGGEAPTLGYSVRVDSVVETAAGIFVTASLQKPEPGMMQGQVITYPQAVVTLKNTDKSVYLVQ